MPAFGASLGVMRLVVVAVLASVTAGGAWSQGVNPGDEPDALAAKYNNTRLHPIIGPAYRGALNSAPVFEEAWAGTPFDPIPEIAAEEGMIVPCPPEGIFEGEPNCGFDDRGLVNGGCGSELQGFTQIGCGETVCSTFSFNGVLADRDWYRVNVFDFDTELTIRVTGSRDIVVAFAAQATVGGTASCLTWFGNGAQVEPVATFDAFEEGSISLCVDPGTYFFFVQANELSSPFSCGATYTVSVDAVDDFGTCPTCPLGACCTELGCDDGPANTGITELDCDELDGTFLGGGTVCLPGSCETPPNDLCADALPITCGDTVQADMFNALVEPNEPVPSCDLGGFVGTVWYTFEGTGGEVFLSTCGTEAIDANAYDSVITVYRADSCSQIFQMSPNEVGCNHDGFCGNLGQLSQLCVPTEAGATYYVSLQVFNDARRGIYELAMSCDDCPEPPTGACCRTQSGTGECLEGRTETQCFFEGGVYLGDDTTCAGIGDLCPTTAPTNDEPETALPIEIGVSAFGNTTLADGELNASCSIPVDTSGLYYTVVGNGKRLTASTCRPGTSLGFDTRLHVYCDATGTFPECVAASEDIGGSCGGTSATSWCSEPGRTYTILVSGFDESNFGPFELLVTESEDCDNPPPCADVLSCSVPCGAGILDPDEGNCSTNFIDTFNGGCEIDAITPQFRDIELGQTVCGTSGSFTLGNAFASDEDWMRFEVLDPSEVTVQADASFMYVIAIERVQPDTVCQLEVIEQRAATICQTTSVTTTLEPGTYYLSIRPQSTFNTSCFLSQYTISTSAQVIESTGACCLSRCDCQITTAEFCATAGGEFGGVGSTCESVECNPCPTDFDGDEVVDADDFLTAIIAFGANDSADVDCDGDTDAIDFLAVLVDFGSTCGLTPGACCLSQCGCGEVLLSECVDAGGVFLGNGTTCETNTCLTCPGDVNNDGDRNADDFLAVLVAFGGGPGGDFDCDGDTDADDFIGMLTVFGSPCP